MVETMIHTDSIIRVDRVTKSFGKKKVLDEIEFTIPRGAVVGLMGTNGAGKSTLIKSMLGLIEVDSGRAELFGCAADALTPEIKEMLGYVPQVVQLYPWMKVKHVIAYTASFYSTWDHAFVNELTTRWHMPMNDRLQGLSTGQLQTLALVLALGHQPELLILDEPVASLDPVARRDFLRSLLEMTAGGERTVLFSTHISSDLERVASHVAILADGKIAHFSELDELKDQVKRVRLHATERLPREISIPGALHTTVDGVNAMAAVTNVTDELLASLKERWNAEVFVEDLNLEEIFVELSGRGE